MRNFIFRQIDSQYFEARRLVMRQQINVIAMNIKIRHFIADVRDLAPRSAGVVQTLESWSHKSCFRSAPRAQ